MGILKIIYKIILFNFIFDLYIYKYIYLFKFSLKPLDIELMKKLHNKVNIVPVIAKSDVLTKKEILKLKKRVMLLINYYVKFTHIILFSLLLKPILIFKNIT